MIVSAAEFRRNIGTYQDRALTEPVFVTRNGRERIVLLSVEEYQRLEQHGDDSQVLEQQRQILGDLQNILNSSDVATLFLDRNLNIRFFTPSARSLFGIIATDVGRPLSDLARRFDDPNLLTDARIVLADLTPVTRKVETEEGVWLTRRILPCRTAEGQTEGVVITFADITEMKSAERELQSVRTYYDSIINAVRQPLIVLDDELRIISGSRSFYGTFGLKPEQAVGLTLGAPAGPLSSGELRTLLDQARTAGSAEAEITLDRPAAGRRVFLVVARQIREDSAAKPKLVVTLDDMADHKRAGEALEAARRQVEQANASKMRILAAASHDLRQPLQTLNLLLGILGKKTTDESVLKLVAKLDETLVGMSGMLNTLLDINHLEAGIVRPEIGTFPISQLFDQLRTEFAYHAEVTGLGWKVVNSRLKVRSDPRLLEQILRNLLSNAVKYTQRGKVLLGCRRYGSKLRIEVRDTGIGITEDLLQLIADKFQNPDQRGREYSLGLGLSVVQRLTSLLNHTVRVDSRLGYGSMFSVEVDLDDEAADLFRAHEPADAERRGGPILIVEDDPAIREMLQLALKGEGYETLAVGDAARLASAPLDPPPCLVIADHVLPNGNGLQVVTSLREELSYPVPAIVLTGDTAPGVAREISRHGCIPLAKPVKTKELLDQLRLLIGERRPIVQNARTSADQPSDGRPTIYVVDDDQPLREAMRDLLEENGWAVEVFVSAEAFMEAFDPSFRGCLLVDARLPGMGGLELLKWLQNQGHQLPAVMMTGYGDVSMAVGAMKSGATDFIEKPVHHDDLVAVVARALEQNSNSAAVSARNEAAAKCLSRLTPREREVMNMVLAGHPSKNIAADLGISQRTVENHRAAIMKKTGSRSLPALIRLALAAV